MYGKHHDELRRIRLQLDLTQERFADLLGTTQNTMSRYERGAIPTPEAMIRLARLILRQMGPAQRGRRWWEKGGLS